MGGLSHSSLALTGVGGDCDSLPHRLDPRAKLVGLFLITIVAVSAPPQRWPVYAACVTVLAAFAAAAGVSPGEIWRRARVVLPLVLLAGVFVPFLRTGGESYELGPLTVHEAGLLTFAAVSAKAVIGTASAVLLGLTTSFPAVLRGLEALRVPRLFVLVAAFMYRYLFVIVEEVTRMRSALAARGYRPRNALQAKVHALFLRTYARGERVYLAMLARGYRGCMPELAPLAFGRTDAAFVALVALALVPLRVAAEVAL
jgi:cobalt/nickel transport system permease protein